MTRCGPPDGHIGIDGQEKVSGQDPFLELGDAFRLISGRETGSFLKEIVKWKRFPPGLVRSGCDLLVRIVWCSVGVVLALL